MGTPSSFMSAMLSASILFMRGSVLGPSHLLAGFCLWVLRRGLFLLGPFTVSVSLSVSNRDGLMRIMHSAERSIIVRVNHMLAC